jgi:hypothetical protein
MAWFFLIAPMVEAVEYYELDWDNDFWKTSLYMGKPTAEGDKAWDNLWNSRLSLCFLVP